MYVPSLTKYVCQVTSLSTDIALFLMLHQVITGDCLTHVPSQCVHCTCTCLRTLVMSSADKNSGAVSPDYLCCFYCCNWKRFKETHCIYMSHCIILFPDIWLGAQVGNNMITSVVFSLLTFFGLLTENQAVLRLQVRRSFFLGCSCLFSHLEIICCKYYLWDS